MGEFALTSERTLILLPSVTRRLMNMIAILPVSALLLQVEDAD